MATKTPVVDIHSHIYPESWLSLLRNRTSPPYIDTTANTLVNRPGVAGKPLLPNLHDISTKIEFMDQHGIDISVLSLGNPWLDFLTTPEEAAECVPVAAKINAEMEDMCNQYAGRLFFFAVLPLSAPTDVLITQIETLSSLYPHYRGVVMGYTHIDSPSFLPVFRALSEAKLPIFFHPNCGLPADVFGPCCAQYGQVMPVSLGFTTETTVAFTRMYLAGVFDQVPDLRVILPHAGGTLPFVIGRIEACISNDKTYQQRLSSPSSLSIPRSLRDVLKTNVYLDGITFDAGALRAAVDVVGAERVMFGTDHPLFPSLRADGKYHGMVRNRDAVRVCFGGGSGDGEGVMGGNAVGVLGLGRRDVCAL